MHGRRPVVAVVGVGREPRQELVQIHGQDGVIYVDGGGAVVEGVGVRKRGQHERWLQGTQGCGCMCGYGCRSGVI